MKKFFQSSYNRKPIKEWTSNVMYSRQSNCSFWHRCYLKIFWKDRFRQQCCEVRKPPHASFENKKRHVYIGTVITFGPLFSKQRNKKVFSKLVQVLYSVLLNRMCLSYKNLLWLLVHNFNSVQYILHPQTAKLVF